MDCFFHPNVPALTPCTHCGNSICATCRDTEGTCPSCRLAARIDAAAAERGELPGEVPRRNTGQQTPPPPGYQAGPQYGSQYGPQYSPYAMQQPRSTALMEVSPETRALVALGYPFWPLAALALLDSKKSPYVRRQAVQAIGFTLGFSGLWFGLAAIAHIPILGLSALPLFGMLVPIYIVASVYYGFRAWRGDDVRVPLISDWLDQREAA